MVRVMKGAKAFSSTPAGHGTTEIALMYCERALYMESESQPQLGD